MVLRMSGASWLTLMMRAERARLDWEPLESDWLLYGPADPQVVQDKDHDQEMGADDAPITLLAAE